MKYSKFFLTVPAAILLTLATFTIPTFVQSERTNQTMEDMSQSANQTGEAIQRNVNDAGSNITEGAKANITEGAKGIAELIDDFVGEKPMQ